MFRPLISCWLALNFFLFCLTFFNFNALFCQQIPYVITIFFKPLEKGPKDVSEAKLEKKFTVPGKAAKTIAQQLALKYPASGIYASYLGYLGISDHTGQIIFPNKQIQNKLDILVTQAILPVPQSLNQRHTLRGFVVDPKARSEFYSLEKRPSKTGVTSWFIEQKPVPAKLINPDTIIILADPKNIIIPTGVYPTIDSGNLVLPDFYTTKDLNLTSEILRFFKFRHFFGPIEKKYAFDKTGYRERISI